MEGEKEDTTLTCELTSNVGGKRVKGSRVGRSRTLLLPTRGARSRVRFREKENEDDNVRQSPHPTTPRSSELKWMREIRLERNKSIRCNNQRTSQGSFSHPLLQTNSRTSPHGPSPRTSVPGSSHGLSSRGPSPRTSELKPSGTAERVWSGKDRERRSRSLVLHEPRRRRSSSLHVSSHLNHASVRGIKLQESSSSSRDSDGGRGRSSLTCELGRSVSDRTNRLEMRTSFGSKREGSVKSPVRSSERSPQSDRLRPVNLELAMALPEEDTMEQMFKLKSDYSGSETETMSMKGILSSLIAIENEEM